MLPRPLAVLTILALVIMIAACGDVSTTYAPETASPTQTSSNAYEDLIEEIMNSVDPERALVYFYRDTPMDGRLMPMMFLIDGQEVASIKHGVYSRCLVAPGRHRITQTPYGDSVLGKFVGGVTNSNVAIDIDLSPGKVVFLRGNWNNSITSISTMGVDEAIVGLATATYVPSDKCAH